MPLLPTCGRIRPLDVVEAPPAVGRAQALPLVPARTHEFVRGPDYYR